MKIIKWLPLGWNKTSYKNEAFDDKDLKIIHWKINWRPWKYKDVLYEEYFWKYAKMTDFYDKLIQMRDSRTEEDFKKDELLMENLSKMAQEDADDPNNYFRTGGKKGLMNNIFSTIKKIIKFRKIINASIFRRKK